MSNHIDRSPFDSLPNQDDWLEDIETPKRRPVNTELLRVSFRKSHEDKSTEELLERETDLEDTLSLLQSEFALRTKIGDKKGAKLTEKRIQFLQTEKAVIGERLSESEGIVTEVSDDGDDTVENTIASERDKEMIDVRVDALREQMQKEYEKKLALVEAQRKDAAEKARMRAEREAEDPEVKAERASVERLLEAERKKNKINLREKEDAIKVAKLEKSFGLTDTDLRAKNPLLSENIVSARVKPESFWNRMKRNLFGNDTTQQRLRETHKIQDHAIRESQERMKPGYTPKQEARPIEIISPTSIREIAGKSAVISARKEVASTTLKPRAQKNESGFFNRLKHLFRKNDPYLNQAKFLDRPYAQESIKHLRGKTTQEENELAEEYIEQLKGDKKAS